MNFPEECNNPSPEFWLDFIKSKESFMVYRGKYKPWGKGWIHTRCVGLLIFEYETWTVLGWERSNFSGLDKQMRYIDGKSIYFTNKNPILDIQMCEGEFQGKNAYYMSDNAINRNLFEQVDQ